MNIGRTKESAALPATTGTKAANHYLNYCPNYGFQTTSAPQSEGYFNLDPVGFIEDVAQEKASSCLLGEALLAFTDPSLWLDDEAIRHALKRSESFLASEYFKGARLYE